MVREILTTPPTDWVSSLEKVYARQADQLAEHHENLRARDKALVAKSELESVPKALEKLASFSTSVSNLVKKRKEIDQEKKDEAATAVAARVAEYGVTTEGYQNINTAFKSVEKDIRNDHKRYLATLKYLQANHPEEYEFMKGLSSYEEVQFRKLLGRQVLSSTYGKAAYTQHLIGTNGLVDYNNLDFQSQLAGEREWQYKQLGHLNLSDEFIVSELGSELHRQNTTRKNTVKNQSLVRIANDNETKWATHIQHGNTNQAIADKIVEKRLDYEALYGTDGRTPDGLTPTQAASRDVSKSLQRLLADEAITFNLSGLNKFLSENIDHPAGKDNHVYFNEEQINGMVAAGVIGEGKAVARHELNRNNMIAQLTKDLITPGSGMTPEKKAAQILQLQGMGASKEEINKLESINVYAQTKEIEAATIKEYTDNPLKIINASDADLNGIENINAQIFIKERKRQLDVGDTELGLLADINSSVQKMSSTVPWPVGTVVKSTGVPGEIALRLNNKGKILRAQMIWKAFDTDGDLKGEFSQTINTVASDYITNSWKIGGGGTQDDNGIYSYNTTTQSFDNYITQTREIATLGDRSNYTTENYSNWQSRANEIKSKYPTKEEFLKSKEFLFNKEDFQHTVLFNDPTDRMEILTDIYPGLTLKEIWKHDLEIHQNNDKADPWVQALNLEPLNDYFDNRDKAIDSMNTGLENVFNLQVKNGFKSQKIADTIRLLNTKRFDQLDPVQKNRIKDFWTESLDIPDDTLQPIEVEIEGGGTTKYYPGSREYEQLLNNQRSNKPVNVQRSAVIDPSLPDFNENTVAETLKKIALQKQEAEKKAFEESVLDIEEGRRGKFQN